MRLKILDLMDENNMIGASIRIDESQGIPDVIIDEIVGFEVMDWCNT